MSAIDYVIIGIPVLISVLIIYRKITGKSKGCSCVDANCKSCPENKKK